MQMVQVLVAVAQIETGSDEFTEDVTMKTGDGALLTLQTSDTTVGDGDVLGALQFQAPNESSGTDAITVADLLWLKQIILLQQIVIKQIWCLS